MKKCSVCGVVKPLAEMATNKSKIGTLCYRKQCVLCWNELARKRYWAKHDDYLGKMRIRWRERYQKNSKINYAQNRAEILAKYRTSRSSAKGRAYSMWASARNRATKSEIEFTLTREKVDKAVLNGVCVRTGFAFDLSRPVNGEQRNAFSPSLDRKDRRKGYTDDNVQVVVWCYNTGKGEMTDEQFVEFCRAVVRFNTQIEGWI